MLIDPSALRHVLPINWASYDGELVERFVSVMLLREFPDGTRRRTTQGDGGIDVIVAVSDNPAIYDVYQIKRYHGPLASDQKTKIKKSAEKLRAYVEENQIAVRYWHLTLPLDQADGEQAWIEGFFEGSEIQARWKGLAFLEGLASKHRDVVDYYLFAGKERVDELVARVLELAQLRVGQETGLDVSSTYQSLKAIHDRLNTIDPNFTYDVAMMHSEPEAMTAPEGVVMSQFVGEPGGPTLRIDVYPAHRYSLEERPITGSVRFVVPDDEVELQGAIERFDTFGEDLVVPAAFAEVSIDDPLSGQIEAQPMTVRLTSPDAERDIRIRLLISELTGARVSSSFFTVYKLNESHRGEGFIARMRSEGGLIELTQESVRSGPETFGGKFNFNLDWKDRVAARILPDVRFGRELYGDRKLVLAQEFSGPYTDVVNLNERTSSPIPQWLVEYVEGLVTLQEYSNAPLKTRGVESDTDVGEINHTLWVASLISGNTLTVQSSQMGLYLEGVEYEDVLQWVADNGNYLMRTTYTAVISGELVSIPNVYVWADDVQAEIAEDADGIRSILLSPVEGADLVTMNYRLAVYVDTELRADGDASG